MKHPAIEKLEKQALDARIKTIESYIEMLLNRNEKLEKRVKELEKKNDKENI